MDTHTYKFCAPHSRHAKNVSFEFADSLQDEITLQMAMIVVKLRYDDPDII